MASLRLELDVPGTEQLIDFDHESSTARTRTEKDIVLIPTPTTLESDPLNWTPSRKFYQLFLLSLYACAFSFGENTLGSAWTTVSTDTGVSLTNMNGGSALNYLLLGFCNCFWIPTAMKFGRRPVFIVTTVFVIGSAVWTANVHGTATWMLSNALNGLGTSAYQAVIQLSIFDTFFAHQRGRTLSIYIFGQQLGSIIGLISGGSMADGPGWRWSQYIIAIGNAVVLLLFIFTFRESLFPRFLFTRLQGMASRSEKAEEGTENVFKSEEKTMDKVITTNTDIAAHPGLHISKPTYPKSLKPWTYWSQDPTSYWQYFRRPFMLFTFPNVVIAGMMFAFGCTAGIVTFNTISEILNDSPYNFSTTATGLVFFAALVGNILGWMTGFMSDWIVLYLSRRNKGIREPEMRLWTLCISFIYAALGYLLYGWSAEFGLSWILVAIGVASMIAHQVSACTVATAYAMDCFPGISGELVVVLAICSSCINFAISYSVQPLISAVGYGYAFTFFGLCVLGSMVTAVPLYIWGKRWRKIGAPKWKVWIAEREQFNTGE